MPPKNAKQADKVSITAEVLDPLSFSDTDANATFEFTPAADGLDYSLSLLAGTEFPEVFSPDGIEFGALASGTSLTYVGRLAPAVVSDPTMFWDSSPLGGIDLYRLVLTADNNHNVTAKLTFGAGTSYFALDYKNHLGQSINPFTDLGSVKAIEQHIASQFVEGVLTTDLTDVLTVGFIPRAATEFTFGRMTSTTLSGVEAPAPSRTDTDVTGGGQIDQIDLNFVVAQLCRCTGDLDFNRAADLNGDGCVDEHRPKPHRYQRAATSH